VNVNSDESNSVNSDANTAPDVNAVLAELSASFGSNLTPHQRSELLRVAELRVLAAGMRAAALDGAAVNIRDLAQIEAVASEALEALRLPPLPKPVHDNRLEVVFVKAAPPIDQLTPAQVAQIDNGLRTRAEIAESLLEGYHNRPETAAGAPNGTDGAQAPEAETLAQRRARAEREAPIVSQSSIDTINRMLTYGNGGLPDPWGFPPGW
jgi:hypothetical protein